ncbi:MAG: glycine cleavage system protein H [Deltaproteobacteria bacterium]|nr:glycine cleavage system protein H [Deltaproteobacteria bacterium]
MDLNKLKYSTDLVWVRIDEDSQATIGLTEEALKDYTELTRIQLPEDGDELTKDDLLGTVYAKKGGRLKIISPLTGEVLAVNEDLEDAPDAILDESYEEGWLIRQTVPNTSELDDLMNRYEYEDFIETESLDDDEEDDDDDDDDDDDFDEDEYDDDEDDFDEDDEDDY